MTIRFLCLLMINCLMVHDTWAFNPKRLELEADNHTMKIFSKLIPQKDMITRSISSVLDDHQIPNASYCQPEVFQELYNATKQLSEEPQLLTFADVCKEIYDQSNDLTKAGVYLLLNKVKEKSLKQIKALNKVAEFKKEIELRPSDLNPDNPFESFWNLFNIPTN